MKLAQIQKNTLAEAQKMTAEGESLNICSELWLFSSCSLAKLRWRHAEHGAEAATEIAD